MGSVVVHMGVSLDGFIAGPDGEIDWHLVDEELHSHMNDVLRDAAAFFEGRVVYELMEGYWPAADAEPDASAHVRDFAGIWRSTPKVVFSRTLDRVGPNAELVRDVVPEDVRARAAQARGPVVVGGAGLAASFAEHDLVDEYRIYVHPVLIGRGRPMFREVDRRSSLRLLESRVFGNGVVLLRYGRP
ncbi:MAG TPA: dihydrofolate reductase family protein [Blastococcus sp.]|jgi:dihydrofolate reductase|nr:dihydrofolate reductase family protein [Blastococcus sp.]